MTSFSAICPAANIAAANAALEGPEDARTGHGPDNFRVPVEGGTHAVLHGWGNEAFYQKMLEIAPTYGIEVRDDKATEVIDGEEIAVSESPVEQVKALAQGMSIVWPPSQDWLDTLPMQGDVQTFDGVEWRSTQDHNHFSPTTNPQGWELVDAPTGPQPWVQPTGAHDAYATGDRVTHPNAQDNGTVWLFESTIDANTTEPGTDGTFHRWWTPIEVAA